MNKPRTPRPGTRRERCARRLGLDHNPLRRPADRVDAWLRLLIFALALTVVPVIAIASGLMTNQVLSRQAQADQRSDHLVRAVLTEQASTPTIDPYAPNLESLVQARWAAPSGAARSGQILAPTGTPAGWAIPIWVNASGAAVNAPLGNSTVVTGGVLIGGIGGLTLILLLMGLQAVARYALDRQRLAAWDAEWRGFGPLWTDHRN